MNCKSQQLAWIKVPASYNNSGLQVLTNRVVRTQVLLPGFSEPIWDVDPPQTVTFTVNAVDECGQNIKAGDCLEAAGIPDAWLRPFDPDSAPEDVTQTDELEQPA